jgi:hypothetical protein
MVKPNNHAATQLYKKLGFELIGHCMLGEAMAANGERSLLMEETSKTSEGHVVRAGLILTTRLHRQ